MYENQKLISPEVRYNKDTESVELPDLSANDLVLLEKFKRWARRNLFVLSGVVIAIAGAIIAVVLVTRSALRRGATLTKRAKKVIDDATKDKGLFSPFLDWISKIAAMGEKGLNFLSKNLWVIILVISFLMVNK